MSHDNSPAARAKRSGQGGQRAAMHSSSTQLAATYESYSGPVAHPDFLEKYERVCPGAADRIFSMAEHEAAHRRLMESQIVSAQIAHDARGFSEARYGQTCALIITIIALLVGAALAYGGREISGSILGVGGISGIVATFILGRHRSSNSPDPQEPSSKK